MYFLLLSVLVGVAAWLIRRGRDRGSWAWAAGGVGLLLATGAFFGLLSFWGEMLWFDAVGYTRRFWTLILAEVATAAAGALIAGVLVWALLLGLRRDYRAVAIAGWVTAGLVGAVLGVQAWDEVMLLLNGVDTGVTEPIFGRDTGFYLFVLPVLDRLYGLLAAATAVALAAVGALLWRQGWREASPLWRHGLVIAVAFASVLAFGRVLQVFHLLDSEGSVVYGAGWTDVHVRLPALLIMAVLLVILATLPLFRPVRQWLSARLDRGRAWPAEAVAASTAWGGIAVVFLLLLGVVPRLVQWLVVEPNEISFERPYIAHNIAFTRRGFRLHEVEQRAFPAEPFTADVARQNPQVLSEVRLWDWRALDAVFKQFQEIRLYYEFRNVDIDRYNLDGHYRQVMVSARELDQSNLAAQSQTFVNRRFKYTHGYGLAMAPVSEFTPSGLPRLLIRDIPPVVAHQRLAIERPQIYYGELTTEPAVVNSSEREFDFPRGEDNAYIHYPGDGGVLFKNLWRKFVFGWKFDGTRLLLSTYPRAESRMMFHRQIRERVETLAPFLEYDADPYITVVDGRLKWIIDAYTTSSHYPYSEPFSAAEFIQYRNGGGRLSARVANYLSNANYVRNSVKAVVDAFDGSVDFYVFDPDDPLIRAWQGVFPGLFQPRTAMPEALEAHIRYPEGFLLAQGLVYAKYHMTNPEVFYNQEDLWVRATERYYGQVQPVEPYYVMWKRPGRQDLDFVLILPFTPKNRQVLIGWIAGMSDPEDYGRFIAYQFPKERRVLGPQQVETKIDQDAQLSAQLSLWDQRGSRVIRGNVLAIPIDQALLYVEPIYLQAETAAYPELRLVVLMHGDTISYAESFGRALQGLFEGGVRRLPSAPAETAPTGDLAELARQAQAAFERYLRLQAEGNFEQAGAALKQLQRLLQSMGGGSGGGPEQ